MPISAQTFAANVASKLGELARVVESTASLSEIYTARGGVGTFTDEELQDTGFAANDLAVVIGVFNAMQLFFNNGQPSQFDRWPTVQKHRGDL